MAGAGYKLFNTGDVLTAAQVNTYLQEQTVMVFASSAARTSALSGVLAEGMVSYLQDTNAVEVYNGSAWVGVSGAGDITEVQAGTGISVASGTGPIPVVTNTVATAFDAAGDLVYGTGADTFTKLALGTANQVLTVNAGATAPEWKTPSAGATAVNKNYLINGGFAIAERGNSFTAGANNDDAYTLDRWYILSDTNDVIDVTQNTATVPTNGQFAIALDVETVNKKFGIASILEYTDCIGLIGNTVTFSFKAKVSSTTKLDNVKAAIVAWSGTADTVTSDIISAWNVEGTNPTLIANATYENSPANLNLTTSYATYSVSAAVDTASTKNIIVFVWSDVTDTTLGDFLYISEAKLELGSTATAFEYAGGTFEGELAACNRYYQEIQFGAGAAADGSNVDFMLPHTTTMRVAPSATVTTALKITDFTTSDFTASAANISIIGNGTTGGRYRGGNFSGLTNNRFYGLINGGGTIKLSAEL